MSSPDIQRPASRYGRGRTPKKPTGVSGKLIAIGLVVLLVLAVVAGARYLNNSQQNTVSAEMTNFERVDDDTMRLQLDVTREDPSQPAYCIVTAIDYAMAEVGRREILLEPGGPEASRHEVLVTTRDVPVSGDVYGCSTVIPSYLDL